MRFLRRTIAALLLSVPALVPAATSAHGGEAEISTFPAQAPPGGEVTVFGEDLEAGASMELHLLTPDGDLLVAEPTTDEEGHFSATVTLPDTLTERNYELRLTMPSGEAVSAFVAVVASETDEAEGSANPSLDLAPGLLVAGVLGVAGIILLVFAIRPVKPGRRNAR